MQFLDVHRFRTLEEINPAFARWLVEYHQTLHASLKATPLGRTTVHFLPWDLSRVFYGDDQRLARPLDRAQNARRFDHPASRPCPEDRHEN